MTVFRLRGLIAECRQRVGCSRPLLGRANDSFRAGSPDQRTSASGPIPVTGCSPARTSASGRSIRLGRSRLWVDSVSSRPPRADIRLHRSEAALAFVLERQESTPDRSLIAARCGPCISRRTGRGVIQSGRSGCLAETLSDRLQCSGGSRPAARAGRQHALRS